MEIHKIVRIIFVVLMVVLLLNLVYLFLNQRIIIKGFECIALEKNRDEFCSCLYERYELAKNPFREFWGHLYPNHVSSDEMPLCS